MAVKLVVIGGGNMAQAIVRGGLDAKSLRAKEVIVVEPDAGKRAIFESWRTLTTVRHADALDQLPLDTGAVLLAVKPQRLVEAADQMRDHMPSAGCLVVSILAGTPSATVRRALGAGAVVRAMPNTAARIRQSITAISAGDQAFEEDVAEAERLLTPLGPTVRIDESLMDAFTALAGSGPAYVFYLAEAMVSAAVSMGFTPDAADGVVRQTIAGAAGLLRESASESPAELRAAVTSKGGTTEAAFGVLTERGVMQSVIDALLKGRDRGREMAGG